MPWVRKAYKGCKVYVEVDQGGEFVLGNRGLASIRYQPNDDRTYTARPDRILSIDEKAPIEPAPTKASSKKTVSPEPIEGSVIIHTDGASSGNPGPSGLGVVLTFQGHRKEISRFLGHRTNNFAELMAIKIGLETLRTNDHPVVLYTDSSYCEGVLCRGWKAQANEELVGEIRSLMKKIPKLDVVRVKGHSGVAENERADKLARLAIEKKDSS